MKPDYKKLFEIAEPQAGYFTTQQASAAGYSRKAVAALARTNRFSRIAQGIYRLNYYPSSEFEDITIAVLKSGPKAVVSHDTALYIYQLSDVLPGDIHITIPQTRSRRHKNIKYHTCRITEQEISSYRGFPITTVVRTIMDVIRSGLDALLIENAVKQAIEQGMITAESLKKQADRYGKKTKGEVYRILERAENAL